MTKQYEALAILCIAREVVDVYASMRVGAHEFAHYAERELAFAIYSMAIGSAPSVKELHDRAFARCFRYERDEGDHVRDQCLALCGLIRDCLAAWLGDATSV